MKGRLNCLTFAGWYIDDAVPSVGLVPAQRAYSTREQGPKTGAAWKKTSWRFLARRRRGVVAATPRNRQWQGDRNVWPTTRAPENRMQCPKGGEVRRKPGVAGDERGDHRHRLAPLVKRLCQANNLPPARLAFSLLSSVHPATVALQPHPSQRNQSIQNGRQALSPAAPASKVRR